LDESTDQKSPLRKGIERVNLEKNKRFDDYGIWVASRFNEVTSTLQSTAENKHAGSRRRPHLSLSSSLASKNTK
jgi:hypothetical protein